MLLFKKKPGDARARLLKLCDEWWAFKTVELDRPHLESRLKGLCERLEKETESYMPVIREDGSRGTAGDVEFLFQVLAELPEGPSAEKKPPMHAESIHDAIPPRSTSHRRTRVN